MISEPLNTTISPSKEWIAGQIEEYGKKQSWNHNIMLPFGIETQPAQQSSHGKNLVKLKRIKPLLEKINLSGKKVLDVGCNEGFFSLQLAAQGAHQVTGIDIDGLRIKKALFVQDVLKENNVTFRQVDIYSDEFTQLAPFDFCLCMGFLHRIPDPYRAIERLASKTNLILFEWKALKHGDHQVPFAYFTGGDYVKDDFYGTPYWLLSYACVESILKRIGFKYFHRIDDPTQKRAILVAGKIHNPLFDEPSISLHRGKIRTFLSHTKRYLKNVRDIFTGDLNA